MVDPNVAVPANHPTMNDVLPLTTTSHDHVYVLEYPLVTQSQSRTGAGVPPPPLDPDQPVNEQVDVEVKGVLPAPPLYPLLPATPVP